jgi:hypothetical protein
MVVIFVNGSGRNDQSQQRTFHRCFLPSCGSFGQTVSEEKNLIFSIVFYFLLIFFTNFQVLEVATAMFDGSRGHLYDPLSDLWLLTLVAYEKWQLSLQKMFFFNSLNIVKS